MLKSLVNRARKLGFLFVVTVVFPVICAILYFGIFASGVFISESTFVVRSPEKQTPTGLGVLLRSTGIGSAGDEMAAVESYVLSRDALRQANKKASLATMYTRPEISVFDKYAPFGVNNSFEDLFRYFQKHVTLEHDPASSSAKLIVRAYTPQDALRLNEQLLVQSEGLVNALNERARSDLIAFAQNEVDEAEARSAKASLALAVYRNAEGVVDPEMQAEVQLQMVSKLQDALITTKAQLAELRAFTPQNPQIEVLTTRVKELTREVDTQLGKVAGDRRSLSSVAARYQRLKLDSQFADRQLAAAMSSLTDAKSEARRKQVYVERIVQPNEPDEPLEPRRIRGILATLALGLVAWGVLSLLLAGVKEHKE